MAAITVVDCFLAVVKGLFTSRTWGARLIVRNVRQIANSTAFCKQRDVSRSGEKQNTLEEAVLLLLGKE